jgi:Ca-activated chloride channel family protein
MGTRIRLLLFAIAGILLLLLVPTLLFGQESSPEADKTAAPYFFVDGDPTVDRLPLQSTAVDARIAGVIADVKVVQRYKNEGQRPIEARYVFPGSTRAAVHGLQMRIGERLVVAEIREKKRARAEYEAAKQEGKTASLLEQHRPNVFQMHLANILPGDEIEVELRYTELLVPMDGQYRFVFPTVVGPRYNGRAASGAAERWPAMPFLRQGEAAKSGLELTVSLNVPVPLQHLASASHKVDVVYEDSWRARVSLSETERNENNRDFILDYRLSGERIASGLMLYQGPDENFFLAMMEPPAAVKPQHVPAREYVFIVDVSGSMSGFPLDTAKTLVRDLLDSLHAKDSFNVLLFAGGNAVLAPQSLPATQGNIRSAIDTIDRHHGGGGTELLPALKRALALPRDENRARTIVLVTDGYVTVEREAFDMIREHLDNANVFAFGIGASVNRYLIEGLARAGRGEPFVVTGSSDAAQEAERFRRYIDSPVLTHIRLHFDGFEAYDVEPASVPDVFAARPVIVFGKWRGEPRGSVTIEALSAAGQFLRSYDVSRMEPRPENAALRHLWARSRIATLSDYNVAQPGEDLVQEVTALGLQYSLLTQYTSFIAVDKVVRNSDPGNQPGADQPSPLPEGVSDLAVGGAVPGTPEPETWALLIVALGVLLWLERSGKLHV